MIIQIRKKKIEVTELFFWMVWISVLAVFVYINMIKYSQYGGVTALDRKLVYFIQVNIQKMFFNANILFSVFLYKNRKQYLNPMQAVRYGKKLFAQILCTGFTYSLIFTVCTYMIVPCIAVLLKLRIYVNYLADMCFFYLIVFQMYLVYTLLYIITERLAVSLVSMSVMYIICAGIVITLQYAENTNSMNAVPIYHWRYFAAADIVLTIVLYKVLRRKDFLSGKLK